MWLLAQFPQNPQAGGALTGVMLCALVVCVAVGTLLGAVILRAACSFYNKLASGADILGVVPEPEFGKAMLIWFASALVQFGLGLVLRIVGVAAQLGPTTVILISIPLSFLVMAGMLSAMLPTTFPGGLLVALLVYVVGIIVALGIVAVVVVFSGGLKIIPH